MSDMAEMGLTAGADISCRHLRKVFHDIKRNNRIVGLGDFDLEIAPSEFITIIGRADVARQLC